VITVREASARFGIPKATIYDYINRGKIRVIRHPLGHRILIPEDELPKLQAISVFYLAKEEEGEEVRL
jgi:excisionase family DNA binding protein